MKRILEKRIVPNPAAGVDANYLIQREKITDTREAWEPPHCAVKQVEIRLTHGHSQHDNRYFRDSLNRFGNYSRLIIEQRTVTKHFLNSSVTKEPRTVRKTMRSSGWINEAWRLSP